MADPAATTATWTYVVDEATGERRAVDRDAYLKSLAAAAVVTDAPAAEAPVDATPQVEPMGAGK